MAVSDECVLKFQELKLNHTLRYVIFKMNEKNTEVIVEATADKTATYDQFIAALPKDGT